MAHLSALHTSRIGVDIDLGDLIVAPAHQMLDLPPLRSVASRYIIDALLKGLARIHILILGHHLIRLWFAQVSFGSVAR